MLHTPFQKTHPSAGRGKILLLVGLMAGIVTVLTRLPLNSPDEAQKALTRIYDDKPHYEIIVKEATHPTR